MNEPRGARTPHREALHRAWAAAEQVEHCDAAGQYESRDFYVRTATMWATIALAERGGTGAWPGAVNVRPGPCQPNV